MKHDVDIWSRVFNLFVLLLQRVQCVASKILDKEFCKCMQEALIYIKILHVIFT
jgi:hypothetical protein